MLDPGHDRAVPRTGGAGNVPRMVAAAFVAPYLLEATARFVRSAASLPDVRLGVITSEPLERIDPELRDRLAGHWRGDDAPHPRQNAPAGTGPGRPMGGGG